MTGPSSPPPPPEPAAGSPALLVVDDEEAIRRALRRFLAGQGYEVVTAATGAEALEAIRGHRVACVLLDVRLPDTSGVDLVSAILDAEPSLAILMLSAVGDSQSAAEAMRRGAMDYLTKPVDLADLHRAVRQALRRRETHLENRQLDRWLEEEVAIRTAELRLEHQNLERVSVAALEGLVDALEAKDTYLSGHSLRVAELSATVAAEMGLPADEVASVRTAGRLHDIGKIGIREAILNKQGPLTAEEFEQVKRHVVTGPQILAPLRHLRPVIDSVRSHHERWDGRGYPDGLAGEAIPLGARIIGAVEIYDALTTERPYQEKMTPELALERLRDLAGSVIDPQVLRALIAVITRRESLLPPDD